MQILVEAMTYEEARALAVAQTEKVYPGATLDWVTEYPRTIVRRPGFAITDG